MTAATGPGVAIESRHTLTNADILTVDNALGVDTAPHVSTGADATLDQVVGVSSETGFALTARLMAYGYTVSVGAAYG